jgi:RHS repeat-associated protein
MALRGGGLRALGVAVALAAMGFALVYAAVVPSGQALPSGSKASPLSLTVFSSSSLPPEVQAQEAASAPLLFDRDTNTQHAAFAESQVQTTFDAVQEVRAIKVFGAAPYLLTVKAEAGGSFQNIAGLENLNLTQLAAGWNSFTPTAPATTSKLLFALTPATGGSASGLREIEVWTAAAPVSSADGATLLEKLLSPNPPAHAKLYTALNPTANPTVGVVTHNDGGGELADNKFTFTVDRDPARFVRAYLTYELYGQSSFVSVRRLINYGQVINSQGGGALLLPSPAWSTQVERINPAWLRQGANTIDFTVLSSSNNQSGYTVRNVRVVGELDNGANAVETMSVNQPDAAGSNPVGALYDGNLETGWRPYPADQPVNALSPTVEFELRRPTEMSSVSVYLSGTLGGQVTLSVKQAGQWYDFPAESGAAFDTGWNTIPVPPSVPLEQRAYEGVRLTFSGGEGSSAEVREFLFTGSPVGARASPAKIVVVYPDAGQFYGRQTYVRGFVEPWDNGSGKATITLGVQAVPNSAGTISNTRTKDSVGLGAQADSDPWSLEVKAVYPNGETVTRILELNQQLSAASPLTGPLAGTLSSAIGPKTKKTISHDESKLVVEAGTVSADTTITVTPLAEDSVPALDVGMVNVTKGPRRGYRFLPHGAKFLKNVNVTLPYDRALIPPGHTEDDVRTYFFDEQAGRWVALPFVGVDKTNKLLNSTTNHFTDMINAVVTVPDHPQAVSFNPTSMKDIKAADPGAQINLIEPPKVNNMGDARVSYPIEVPPGRQGMQPQLSIGYNSSGGNAWLGVGWDLSTPSISIDTRFGVPKYDESKREETYLLNGQQMVKVAEGEYRLRVEGSFQRIRRHGTAPANYWWVVTDKNGLRQIFGGDVAAQLRDPNGRGIFVWHLSRTVDSNGNTVDYEYLPKNQPVHNSGEQAVFTYLREVRYTGSIPANQADAAVRNIPATPAVNYYRVRFNQDTAQRLDSVMDGRGAFKTVMDERLKSIEVSFVQGGAVQPIRSYVLNYRLGDFDKTLLESIVQKDANGQDFGGNRHSFTYFTMPTTRDGYDAFTPVEGWSVPALQGGLSLTTNRDVYAGTYLGFMIQTDAFHIGGGFGAGKGDSKTDLSTVDLNGDGLMDFLESGNRFYKNHWSHAAHSGRSFTGNDMSGAVDSLGFEKNELRSRDVGIHIGDHSGGTGGNLTAGKSSTTITGSKMLADINGDGLVDQLSASGGSLTVQLNNGNGFDAPTNWAGGANITPPLTPAERQQLLNDYPLSDPVRAWQAPFAGTVSVSGTVAKPVAANTAQGEDGVKLTVFKGSSPAPLYEKSFVGAETVDLAGVGQLQNLSVLAGESLYFKLNSAEDSDRDLLDTNFNVAYNSVASFAQLGDAHYAQTTTGDQQFSSSSQAGFAMASLVPCHLEPAPTPGNPGATVCHPGTNEDAAFTLPYKGRIRLTSSAIKLAVAEDLVFRVTRIDASGAATLASRLVPAGDTSGFSEVLDGIEVNTDTRLLFDISSPKLGTVRADRVQWTPEVRYTNVCTRRRAGENVDDPSTIQPGENDTPGGFLNEETCSELSAADQELTDRDIPGAFDPQDGSSPTKLYIFKPTAMLNVYPFKRQAPMYAWIAPRDGVVRLVASALKNAQTSSDIHLKVQSTNQLIAQHTLAAAAISPSTQVMSVNVPVTAGQRLFFNVHSRDAIPATYTDAGGIEQPVFDWTPELLYVDSPHCYTDATSGQQVCVPVATSYSSASAWTMHFDNLCLAQDRCVPVDCTGARTPGVFGERAADQCRTPEPATLSAAERAAFNLNRIQYVVPLVNRDHLDWSLYANNPFQGFYRDWSYLAWNGNFAWDTTRLTSPPEVPSSPTQEAANNVQIPYFWQAQPLGAGDKFQPGVPLWIGPGERQFMSAAQAQSTRLGGNVTPFVSAGQGAGISLLRRTRNEQTRVSLGFGSFGGSLNFGPAKTNVDLIDLNGDRYPDQVADNAVVFNRGTPGSGFEGSATGVDFGIGGEASVRRTESRTAGLSASIFRTEMGAGHEETQFNAGGKAKGQKSQGISIGTGYGSNKTVVDFIDINGDGLPDRVRRDGGNVSVRLNLGGDRFGAEEQWVSPSWSVGNVSRLDKLGSVSPNAVRITDTVNASASFFAASGSRTIVDLTDMNGDGLPDLVLKEHGRDHFLVRINRGSGFDPEERKWYVPGWGTQIGRGATALLFGGNDVLNYNETATVSKGFGYPFHFHIQLWLITLHIFIEPEVSGTVGQSASSLALQDIDGDGFLDQVYRTSGLLPGLPGGTEVRVKRSTIGKTNVLKSVSRPLGGSFAIDYVREGNFVDRSNPNNVVEMNSSKWVMSSVVVSDGQGNLYPTQYKHFTSGFYHRGERESFGFSHCQEIRADGATTDYFYHNQDFTRKGLLFRKVYRDSQGRLFTREESTYDVLTVRPAEGNRPAVRFPALARTEKHFYEGQASASGELSPLSSIPAGIKRNAQSFTYETTFGNVVAFNDEGDLDTPLDNATASIGYFQDPAAYIVKPDAITVMGGGQTMRQRNAAFETGTGNLRQVQQAAGGGQVAVTDLTYFPNGNLQSVVGPANHVGQRYTLSYEYDADIATHVSRIRDSFGLSSQANYNLLFGKIAVSADTNNNTTTTNYDALGRVSNIVGPYEQGTGDSTLRFEYHPEATVPYALTQHFDVDADGNTKSSGTIDTVLFTDGLKRVLQTKKDATVLEGNAPLDRMIVSGRVVYDEVGRTIRQFYPVVEGLGQAASFNSSFDASAPPTQTAYDILDRPTRITIPDGTFTTTTYGFGADRSGATQFEMVVTDANVNAGQRGSVRRTYRDARELITAVKELNNAGGEVIWTSYAYDPLRQLTQVLDDKLNTTKVSYDNLGRRIVIENPDTGRTEMQYDAASNLTKKITANLRAQAKSVDYSYDFKRLVSITYPGFPSNNVSYGYGTPGALFNGAGRITRVTSQMGVEERQYGKLGEMVYEKKTINTFTDPQHPSVFETRYHFETFGRLLRITYPDLEIVTNVYDSGGNLTRASGVKRLDSQGQNHRYNYLHALHYDRFEQRVLMEQGNGVKTAYAYNAQTRRLANLSAVRQANNIFQNLHYTYDKVGNVLGLQNAVAVPPPNTFGGPTTQTFVYDDLYRLTHAQGTFQYSPSKSHTYNVDVTYDSIHNILRKNQLHQIVQPSSTAITQKKTTYDFTYQYAPSGPTSVRPHAPTHIGVRTYTYDANGNQTGWTHDQNGTRRTIVWDDENRIQSLFDNGHEKTYKYDDQGQRIIKRGPQGETLYVNQFYTQRPGATGTKHIYAGTSRIASKLLRQDVPGANSNGKTPFEKDMYFYHGDQLGTSNYITDLNGKLYEHLEYFPFGESWVEENSNVQRTPYLFTAKEYDEETGLYYFGARYYDPRTSVWQSGDPILEKYLPSARGTDSTLAGMGGIYNPQNIALYSYAHLNPVRLTDPDGREVRLQWHKVMGNNYHAFVRIMPENQQKYANDPRFQNIDEQGRRYATIGAGPEGGNLVSNINRSADAERHEGGNIVSTPSGFKNEDEFIEGLFRLDANYGDNLDYDLFPAPAGQGSWWLPDDSYNSNSYASGLLQATGATVAAPPVNAPGFNKPVPANEFAPRAPAPPKRAATPPPPSMEITAP